MRELTISSFLVASLALGAASGPPVDDFAQTKADRDVPVMVLINDPAGSEIVSAGAPDSGVATVEVAGDQIIYKPNGFEGEDSFTYDTSAGTATVTVAVTASQPTTIGPVDDSVAIEVNESIVIPILDNDPEGTLLLGVNEPGPDLPNITRGTVEIRGNEVHYTARPEFEGIDIFTYQTQNGTATVTVNIVQSISDQPVTATVFLRNASQFQAEFRITSSPGVFLDCQDPTQAFGFRNLAPPVAMEPFSELELCIEVPRSTVPQSVTFVAEEVGVTNPQSTQPLTCQVSATQDIAVQFNQDRQFDANGFLVVDRRFLTCEDVP